MATVEVRLKELLKERKMTQRQLADLTGIGQARISHWAGNKVDRLDRETIAKICIALNCEVGDLLYIDHEEA